MKYPFNLIAVTSLIFALSGSLLGQDGSNIRYVKPSELAASDIGKWVHLDFGNRSFAIAVTKLPPDTVDIEINGRVVRFKEHRQEDELNHWYECQYLEATESVSGQTLRITRNKLLAFDKETIRVEAFVDYFTLSGNKVKGKTFTQALTFRKDSIAELLVKIDEVDDGDDCPT